MKGLKVLTFAVALCASSAHAQPPAPPAAETEAPCPSLSPEVQTLLDGMLGSMLEPGARIDFEGFARNPAFQTLREAEEARQKNDWANLCRYKQDNRAQLAQGSPSVVFIGDSITEFWLPGDRALFTDGVIDRGISGQTSSQMLVRFQADVIALRPRAVHIMAGTNDVAGNTGVISDEDYKNNIRAMVTLARASNVKVILASIPPAARLLWRPELRPAPRIEALNAWLRLYARETGSVFVDYHAALRDAEGGLAAAFGNDGVHPNRSGYAAMRPLARRAIAEALRAPRR